MSIKVVAIAQAAAKQDLYLDLETSIVDPWKSLRLLQSAMQWNQAKGIVSPKYIEDQDERSLNWMEYCKRLLNEEFPRKTARSENPVNGLIQQISREEVDTAITQMKRNKAVGPYEIPTEFWKKCADVGCKSLFLYSFDSI